MKTRKLRTQLLLSFLAVTVAFGLLVAALGYFVIENDIIERAQHKVKNDLNSAREIYQQEVGRVRDVVRLTAVRFFLKEGISENDKEGIAHELERIWRSESLDVLTLTDVSGRVIVRSRNPLAVGDEMAEDTLASRVLDSNEVVAGTVIVPRDELLKESPELAERAYMKFLPTPKARPRRETEETSGMMIKAAAPVLGADGRVQGVLYGGKLLNRDYMIVDKVKETVYRAERYKGKDVGTATIFQGDLRISTNVQTEDGARAIGTRVSAQVNEQVLEKGLSWMARAFVVNDWYKTAYEPIKDVDGRIIGILYVGILEQPFVDMARNILLVYMSIVVVAMLLAAFLGYVLAGAIVRPVGQMAAATRQLSSGNLGYTVERETGTAELNTLAASFKEMSEQLQEREDKLKAANEQLAALNNTYLDLVGFVSHELKGIIATIMMNVMLVRDGYVGGVNEKQKKPLDAAKRSLDYLAETVRKFLDLSRIEKGELEIKKAAVLLLEDVFSPCLETFAGEISTKQMDVSNNIAGGIELQGDPDLLRVVANNLIGNAIKYGMDKGRVILSLEDSGRQVRVEVYNDSRPITEDEKERLFKRFSRLGGEQGKRVKGTGLGLFITKEIIDKHGGRIWVEPRENGNSFIFEIGK
jgi:two-component system NtrC family sensor kinase